MNILGYVAALQAVMEKYKDLERPKTGVRECHECIYYVPHKIIIEKERLTKPSKNQLKKLKENPDVIKINKIDENTYEILYKKIDKRPYCTRYKWFMNPLFAGCCSTFTPKQ